jgi:hypothetical protein
MRKTVTMASTEHTLVKAWRDCGRRGRRNGGNTQSLAALGLALLLSVAPREPLHAQSRALTIIGLDREFSTEDVDVAWSTTTQGRILERIEQMSGLEGVTVRVECRTYLCRLEFVEARKRGDTRPYGSFYELAESFGLEVLGVRVQASPDTERSLAYLAREQPVEPL